jgi:hypothetical protein
MTELPHNGQYYTIKELIEAKGTSLPVRSALLTMESRILALEHDLAESAEQHEAFKQEVSGVMTYIKALYPTLPRNFNRFIIPAPKPDPLVEALKETYGASLVDADDLRAALEARGLEIREKNDD